MKIIFVSSNVYKYREVIEIIANLGLKLDLEQFPWRGEETEKTFLENALRKARYGYEVTKTPAISEDSGLVVYGLDGLPGVFTSNFDEGGRNVEKLIEMVKDLPLNLRRAKYVCYACFYFKTLFLWSKGEVEGVVIPEKMGDLGFAYDPVFLYPPLGKTFGQLGSKYKNKVSHRKEAFERLFLKIKKLGYVNNLG